jgi:histidyl-tRNA synthetase
VLGDDELAQGKVKIKEMGLRDGHPEKEGVLVELANIAEEVKQRLLRKAALDGLTQQAEGLRVVHGIRGEEISPGETAAAVETAAPVDASVDAPATDASNDAPVDEAPKQ